MRQATLTTNKELQLKFFDKDSVSFFALLEQVKSLDRRKFNPETKTWNAALTPSNIEKIKSLDFDIDPEILNWQEEEQKRIEAIKEEIKNIEFSDARLFDFQVPHAKQILLSLLSGRAALDASDTGTGKTFVALAIAAELKLRPIVITPKSVIPGWQKAAKIFGLDIFVSNYEQYRTGKLSDILSYSRTEDGKEKYIWHTTEKDLIIFDEIHRTKNDKTKNSKMLRATKKSNSKVLGLSATLADNPMHLYSLGLLLNIFSDYSDFWRWAYGRGVVKGYWGIEFFATPENLKKIHSDIFPKHGSRIKISELGDLFPDNKIICDPYNMGANAKKVQATYNLMHKELKTLYATKEQDKGASILTEILRARQEIELLKIPTIVEMAEDLVEEGNSVAIFVNFKESIKVLSEKLKCKCIIDGSITGEEREKNIEAFQNDKSRIILCNIKAGGVGISLHDLNGNHARVSLISPPQSATDLVQTFGRIHRAGAKTKAVQKLLFCARTIEEEVAEKVSAKIDNIKMINDGDLGDESLSQMINQNKEEK